jgi:hypothetical protein
MAQIKKKVYIRKDWFGKKQPLGTIDTDGYTLMTIEEGTNLVWETWTK